DVEREAAVFPRCVRAIFSTSRSASSQSLLCLNRQRRGKINMRNGGSHLIGDRFVVNRLSQNGGIWVPVSSIDTDSPVQFGRLFVAPSRRSSNCKALATQSRRQWHPAAGS